MARTDGIGDHDRKRRSRAKRLGRRHYRDGRHRGSLVARLCAADIVMAYEDGYERQRVKMALRYPGSSGGYAAGRF